MQPSHFQHSAVAHIIPDSKGQNCRNIHSIAKTNQSSNKQYDWKVVFNSYDHFLHLFYYIHITFSIYSWLYVQCLQCLQCFETIYGTSTNIKFVTFVDKLKWQRLCIPHEYVLTFYHSNAHWFSGFQWIFEWFCTVDLAFSSHSSGNSMN